MLQLVCREIKNVEQVKKMNLIFYCVSKKEVIKKDYTRIINSLEILKKAGKEAKGKLFIFFDGFDDDEREIYMIQEIREYVQYIYERYKYIFYFLSLLDNNRSHIFTCINNYKVVSKPEEKMVTVKLIYDNKIKNDTIKAMMKYGEQIGEKEMQREIFTFI